MYYLLISILISGISSCLFAAESEMTINHKSSSKTKTRDLYNKHYPIFGDRASTVGHLRLNFDKMPGGQSADSFIMNSLTLGLGDRFEIGVIPWVYMFGNNEVIKYGVCLKYNFYKSDTIQISYGATQIKSQMKAEDDGQDQNLEYDFNYQRWNNYQTVSANYTPQSSRFNFGATLKYTEIVARAAVNGTYMVELEGSKVPYPINQKMNEGEYSSTVSLDMNYHLKSNSWIGFALGSSSLQTQLNPGGQEEDEEMLNKIRYTAGLSYIYRKKISVFQDPRLYMTYFEAHGTTVGMATLF
jgi:hypothetical protein